jgi:hypothetical protein
LPVHTDPQKVSPVFMDPLADALRHAAKWLKSSSRNCLIIPKVAHCGLAREPGTEPEVPFRRLSCHLTRALDGGRTIYQTVSLRSTLAICNGKGTYARRLCARREANRWHLHFLPRPWQEGSQCSEIGHSLGILARARGGALSPACPLRLLLQSGGDRGLRRLRRLFAGRCARATRKKSQGH